MTEILYGRRPVLEVLRAKRRSISKIEMAAGIQKSGVVRDLLLLARRQSVPIVESERTKLDKLQGHHQGILAHASPYPYVGIEEILQSAKTQSQTPTLLLLDLIQNPQNLGTLLRTAEAVGIDGVVIPLRRGVGVTPAVVRTSAGASEHLSIARHNLARAIELLKNENFWIFGLENSEAATEIGQTDLPPSIGVIVGGEGEGMRRLSRESCDQMLRLPMRGQVASLNAAVAGSIALYFIWHSRGFNQR
jgi:23S rRNA (guanosine2251-2'-O)-methyltransferase